MKRTIKIKEYSLRSAFTKACKSIGLTTPSELTGERKIEWEKKKGDLDIPDFFFNFLVNQLDDDKYKYDKKIISIFDGYGDLFGYAIINIDNPNSKYESTVTIVTLRKDVSRVLFVVKYIHSEMCYMFNRKCVIRVCIIENTNKETIDKYKGFKSDFIISYDGNCLFGEVGGKLLSIKNRNFAIENIDYPNLKLGLIDLRPYSDLLCDGDKLKNVYTPIDLVHNDFYMKDKIPNTDIYSTNYHIVDKELNISNYGYDKFGVILPMRKSEINSKNPILKLIKGYFGNDLYKYSKKELLDRFSIYIVIYKPEVESEVSSLKDEKFDKTAYENRLYLIKDETSLILDKLIEKTS